MSNHCIDCVCLGCGLHYDSRGSGNYGRLSETDLKKVVDYFEANFERVKWMIDKDEKCCKDKYVLSDGIIYDAFNPTKVYVQPSHREYPGFPFEF